MPRESEDLGGSAKTTPRWLTFSIFPAALVVVLGGGFVALDGGIAPSAVAGVGTLVSLVLVATLERIVPYRPAWNRSQGDLPTDLLYLPTYLGVNALVEPFVRGGSVLFGAWLARSLGIDLWPTDGSLLAQFALACVVVEAFDYWPHRLLHEVPALWRFHAIHHNPKRVYWLNATRAHPVEIAFRGFVNVIPLAAVGAGEPLLAMVSLANALLGFFQHANVDFQLGPLNWIFSVGEMHRWHHSVALGEANNNNYGSNFLFWDIIFGTRYHDPTRGGPAVVGIEQDDLPESWWRQLSAPFRSPD